MASKTPPLSESIPVYDIVREFRILLSKCKNYSQDQLTWTRRTLSLCRGVFSSEAVASAFIYLCSHGAATAWILQVQLGLPEATAFRVLKRLRALGVVEPVLKLPRWKLKRSGPVPKVWGLPGCSKEEVASCINLHYRCLSPKYRLAQEVAQSMLTRYVVKPKEVSYREILIHIRELRVPFTAPDIADMSAQYLHERGIKVWR